MAFFLCPNQSDWHSTLHAYQMTNYFAGNDITANSRLLLKQIVYLYKWFD